MPGTRCTRKGGRRGRRSRRKRTQKQREGSQAGYARSVARRKEDKRLRAEARMGYMMQMRTDIENRVRAERPGASERDVRRIADAEYRELHKNLVGTQTNPGVFRQAEAEEEERARRKSASHKRKHKKSVATVSLGGIFDRPMVGLKSKGKPKHSMSRSARPAHTTSLANRSRSRRALGDHPGRKVGSVYYAGRIEPEQLYPPGKYSPDPIPLKSKPFTDADREKLAEDGVIVHPTWEAPELAFKRKHSTIEAEDINYPYGSYVDGLLYRADQAKRYPNEFMPPGVMYVADAVPAAQAGYTGRF